MLVLSRRPNQDVVIRVDCQVVCTVRVTRVDSKGQCKLAFAPRDADVMINRIEVDKEVFPNEYVIDATTC